MDARINFYEKSQSTRGSVLLMVVVIGMILLVVITAIFMMIRNYSRSQTYQKSVIEFNIMLKSIRAQISNPQICSREFLQNQPINLTNLRHNVSLNKLSLEDGIPFNVGDIVYDKFRLVRVQLVRESFDENYEYDIQVDASVPARNNFAGHLEITVQDQYGKMLSNTPGMRMVFEQIPIFFNVANNRIRSCYGENTVAHYCERLGGAWNEFESNLDQRCNPNIRCFNKNLLEPSFCGHPYKSVQIGSTATPIYLCQWCNSHRKD